MPRLGSAAGAGVIGVLGGGAGTGEGSAIGGMVVAGPSGPSPEVTGWPGTIGTVSTAAGGPLVGGRRQVP